MNSSNISNASNISATSDINSFSPIFNISSLISPSPVSVPSLAPLLASPSPSEAPIPSEYTPSPVPSVHYERANFSGGATGTLIEHRRQEINFFLGFVGISFFVLIVFLYATRGYISNLWKDTREFIEIEQDEVDQVELKTGVFSSSGESKYYEHKEDVGITRSEVAFGYDV